MKILTAICSAIFLLATSGCVDSPHLPHSPHMATGIKIGEVTDSTAIVWVRLTRNEARVDYGAPMPEVSYTLESTGEPIDNMKNRQRDAVPSVSFPGGSSVDTIEGATPGSAGFVRVRYKSESDEDFAATSWKAVNPAADFTQQFQLTSLQPGSRYSIEVDYGASKDRRSNTLAGAFRTAPARDVEAAITFTVVTGQRYPHRDADDGFKIYRQMQNMDPDFFVHTGDILYYDEYGKTPELANWHWQRIYSLGSLVDFHRNVPSYFMKDDHDTLVNDSWPTMHTTFMGELTFEKGLKIFREQVPMGDKTYRTVRWGKDLQIWMVEGRDFRSSNTMEDGPDKTIWGAEQMAWFKRTVQESDASFRVLISPTPIVGPDRDNKNDNHANPAFSYEGNLLREFIATQENMIVVCGDRHWQYVSVDATHGIKEYSTGPVSDEHAGGWSNDMLRPEHQYLNVIGGFLAVTVERQDGEPILIARHHGVDGEVLNEDRVWGK